MIISTIKEKIYSGILGKAIGVRLGAPIEPYQWDYERIQKSFGDIRGYLKNSRRFAADDDTNGPVYFIRTLLDHQSSELAAENVGRTWLNYARDGQGMFWWGGEGVSTEHTAYSHLKNGIVAPKSGSAELNGKMLSEQVGGQIFIDSWGLIHPTDIENAMNDAEKAASVAHDGEALVGARFIAGLIAGAFTASHIPTLMEDVLDRLDATSEYVQVMWDVLRYYRENPHDFRKAYEYVVNNYSYDHYEGACPVIPNACIVAIGLLYSEGDFSRSIEITCMCGWDTDSNAGVVGTIMGVFVGFEGIPHHYREPLNDTFVGSGMSPTLNVIRIPEFAELLYGLSQKNAREVPGIHLTFPFKGSSCGLQIHNDFRLVKDRLTWESTDGFDLLVDNLIIGDIASVFYQTFYSPLDFGDNRYDPVFAPLAFSGQTFTVEFQAHINFLDALHVAPYIRLVSGEEIHGDFVHAPHQKDMTLQYRLPDTHGGLIREVGIKIMTTSQPIDGNGLLGRLKITRFSIDGPAIYELNSASFEKGFLEHVAPFSNHRLKTVLESGKVRFCSSDIEGISFTGDYFTKDLTLKTQLKDITGQEILITYHIKGLENYVLLRLTLTTLTLERRRDLKNEVLMTWPLTTDFTQELPVELKIEDSHGELLLRGELVARWDLMDTGYGHFGFGARNSSFLVEELSIKSSSIIPFQ